MSGASNRNTDNVEMPDPGATFVDGGLQQPGKQRVVDLDALENDGFPNEEFEITEGEPEIEEASETETEPEEEEVEDEQVEEAPPEGVGKKASERFRKLARERNEALESARQERAQNAELLRAMHAQTQQQARVFDNAARIQSAHEQRQQRTVLEERLRLQYAPEDVPAILESLDKQSAIEQQLQELKATNKQFQLERAQERYRSALSKSFDDALRNVTLPEGFDRSQLEEDAYAIASAMRLTPAAAAQRALRPTLDLLKHLPPKVAPKKKVIAESQKAAHDAVAMRGRSGMRKAGDKTSGKPRKPSIQDFEGDPNAWD